ncbi:MAG: 1,4-dihydroxy-2-naphthoate polyprenyltransferase [Sedimentisphaerales bacterium]|nr:1,4-dihydroxy-2-naphthoate polyprenyltransferase [Sedimentisphaerales bacterium]
MTKIKTWLIASRAETLMASTAPVIVGGAIAFCDTSINVPVLLMTFLTAALIQCGTNLANDYYDHLKGTDTVESPGQRRAINEGLVTAKQVKAAFIISFALAVLLGLYLVYKGGPVILIIGLISIASGLLYTAGPFALAYIGLGDIFVLLFFGPVASAGTYYLQTATINRYAVIAGLAPGLLSVGILNINNLRDIQTDSKVNKKTLIVRLGYNFGILEYIFCIAIACLVPVYLCFSTGEHFYSLASLIILVPAVKNIKTICARPDDQALNKALELTAKQVLIYTVLFSVGWIL